MIWLQGAACTGCSVSFLNRISPGRRHGRGRADQLDQPDLSPHFNGRRRRLSRGRRRAGFKGRYILGSRAGFRPRSAAPAGPGARRSGRHLAEAVTSLPGDPYFCAWHLRLLGRDPRRRPEPDRGQERRPYRQATVNIAGCPPHPDWMVWAIVQLLGGTSSALDAYGRPETPLRLDAARHCPRKEPGGACVRRGQQCLKKLGCRGPVTMCHCPSRLEQRRELVRWSQRPRALAAPSRFPDRNHS